MTQTLCSDGTYERQQPLSWRSFDSRLPLRSVNAIAQEVPCGPIRVLTEGVMTFRLSPDTGDGIHGRVPIVLTATIVEANVRQAALNKRNFTLLLSWPDQFPNRDDVLFFGYSDHP
jgi:hypothetical protein